MPSVWQKDKLFPKPDGEEGGVNKMLEIFTSVHLVIAQL
jgi:hypothetical protein